MELTLILLMSCALAHILSAEALKRRMSRKPELYGEFFKRTSFVATGVPKMEFPYSLHIRHLLPFSKNTKKCDALELAYLYTARVASWVAVLVLTYAILMNI